MLSVERKNLIFCKGYIRLSVERKNLIVIKDI